MHSDHLNRIEGKIDKIDDRMDRVEVHMAVYNEQLKTHIKRTDLLEESVLPVVAHVKALETLKEFFVKGMKVLAWGLGLLATTLGVFKALS